MPLTPIQKKIACLLSQNRSPESHLAGGAALHFEPNSMRYSKDLDYFDLPPNDIDTHRRNRTLGAQVFVDIY